MNVTTWWRTAVWCIGEKWQDVEEGYIQLVDDLSEKKSYTDLKKAAEEWTQDRSVWKTMKKAENMQLKWEFYEEPFMCLFVLIV